MNNSRSPRNVLHKNMTIKYYLDTRRPRMDGTCPLRIAFGAQGKTAYQPTAYSLRADQWKNGRVVNHERAAALNIQLRRLMLRLIEASEASCGTSPQLPPSIIRERTMRALNGGGNVSVVETFARFARLKERASTVESFNYTRNMIALYSPDIAFEDISVDWLTDFERWLTRRRLRRNTVAIHLENLRAVVNYAINEELTNNYPFKRYRIRRELSPRRALTLDEMRALWRYMPRDPTQRWYLDCFRLSFALCGMNVSDLAALTLHNLVGGRIVKQRQKTGVPLSIRVEPESEELLKRLKGSRHLVNISERYANIKDFIRRCNEGLKRMGEITKREGRGGRIVERTRLYPELTTYYARHTWATIAAELGTPVEVISLGLGHKCGLSTTQVYITPPLRLLDEANRRVLDAVCKE